MICPECLEAYEFVDFNVNPENLEHRGVFKCLCAETLVFPETMTREMLSEEDFEERLKISRLLHLRQALAQDEKLPLCQPGAIQVETRSLMRYIEHFSEQSLRNLK